MNREDTIDLIRWTLVEGYDQTLDYQGPNWEYIAERVYEEYVAPTLAVTTAYGFTWGPAEIERTASMDRGGGLCRVISVYVGTGKDRKRRLEIYVSPTGKSVRVFRGSKELK